jgi:cobalt-zinc-cadmium efflux system membrane fusion protein
MDTSENRSKLIASVAAAAIVLGGGGILLGRTLFAPTAPVAATAVEGEEAEGEEAGHGAEGFVEMDMARATAAGIATETTTGSPLGAEIIAQGLVAATPEGEAALTARADGAVTRITKRLGDHVRAGEAVVYLESRDASTISAERSTASAKAIAARSAYAREKRLFDARVTARQDLEAAQAVLGEAEAELRRTQSAASAAKVSGDGRSLAVTSLISGRVTKVDTQLGAYVLAGAELFRVANPDRVQIQASVLPADAQRIRPGDAAVIELPGGGTLNATVRSATPGLDLESRTATVVLTPEGTSGIAPGQGLRVRVTPKGAPTGNSVALPEEAVQSVEGRDVVFVRKGKGFQATPVTVGMRSGGRVDIVAGVEPGAVVATKGAFLLKSELGKAEAEH